MEPRQFQRRKTERPPSGKASQPSQPTTAERQQQAKQTGPVEIPQNLDGLSVKELKNILDALGVKRDDCFEKSDLIKRIDEYK